MKTTATLTKLSSYIIICLLIFLFFNLPSIAQTQASLLYDRLGGSRVVAAVVDDFIDGLLANPVIAANEKIIAGLARTTKAGLKFHLTEFICQATGGPQKYTGKPIKDSHADLAIGEAEWNAMVEEFKKSLAKYNVLEVEQSELITIVAITKNEVVTVKPPPPAPLPTKAVPPPSEVVPVVPPQGALPEAPSSEVTPQGQGALPEAPPKPAPEAIPPTQVPQVDPVVPPLTN